MAKVKDEFKLKELDIEILLNPPSWLSGCDIPSVHELTKDEDMYSPYYQDDFSDYYRPTIDECL